MRCRVQLIVAGQVLEEVEQLITEARQVALARNPKCESVTAVF